MNALIKIIRLAIGFSLVLLVANGCVSTNGARHIDVSGLGEGDRKAIALAKFKEGAELLWLDTQTAANLFLEAIEYDPELMPAYYNAGVAEEALRNYDAAQKDYEACLSKVKEQSACFENLLLVLLKKGEKERAKQVADDYFKEYPDAAFVQVGLAKVALVEKDLKLAESHARSALELDSDNVEALLVMARIYFDRGEYYAAKWVAKNALELAPEHGGLYLILGDTQEKLDLLHDAMDAYENAVKFFPNEESLERYGLLLLSRGKVAEALKIFERLTKLRPDTYRNWLHLGNAELANKHFKEAKSAYEKALQLKKDATEINFNLALLYVDLKPEGVSDLERQKAARGYFNAFLAAPGKAADRIPEAEKQRKALTEKIEYAETVAKEEEEMAKEAPVEEPAEPVEAPPEPLEEPAEDEAVPEAEPEEPKEEEKPKAAKPEPKKAPPKAEAPKNDDGFDEEEEDFFDDF